MGVSWRELWNEGLRSFNAKEFTRAYYQFVMCHEKLESKYPSQWTDRADCYRMEARSLMGAAQQWTNLSELHNLACDAKDLQNKYADAVGRIATETKQIEFFDDIALVFDAACRAFSADDAEARASPELKERGVKLIALHWCNQALGTWEATPGGIANILPESVNNFLIRFFNKPYIKDTGESQLLHITKGIAYVYRFSRHATMSSSLAAEFFEGKAFILRQSGSVAGAIRTLQEALTVDKIIADASVKSRVEAAIADMQHKWIVALISTSLAAGCRCMQPSASWRPAVQARAAAAASCTAVH